MSFSDIQGTPVLINLFFVNTDSAPPPSPHPLLGLLETVLLSNLPPNLKASVQTLLSTPLDQMFDDEWSQLQGTAQGMVQQAIQGAQPNAYGINVTFPPKGTFRAQVGNLSSGMLDTLPPGTSGMQLTLGYFLPGVSASFSETTDSIWGSWADPSYNLTFDAEIEIAIAVPSSTLVPLGVKAEFIATNMQAGPGNFFAVLIGIEDAISAWLNDQPFGTGSSLQDQNVPIPVPGQQLFSELSSGFAIAASLGFVQLGVQIDTNPPSPAPPGNTVEFDLTHPFDPGPLVTNALAPQGPSLVQPQIGTSAPEVNAGGQLGVTGNDFPPAQSTQLSITWTDTTSGTVVQSEVQWGVAPDCQTPPATLIPQPRITRHGPYDNANIFTPKIQLTPNTCYGFRVRDFDVPDFIATDWSAWVFLQTAATDQVQLTLGDGNDTLVGFATVQTDGTFLTTVIIPQNEPPGTYELLAGQSGHRLAQTPITIVAAGQTLQQVLQIINPESGIAFTGTPSVIGRSPVTVRGSNFSPGIVDLFIDSTSGTSFGQFDHLASDTFTVTITWPFGVTGPHTILAQQDALQAIASVFGENPQQ